MGQVVFYHHERADGGERTGVTVGGDRALEQFLPGPGEPDPILLWYVDVICQTDSPPQTQGEAADWLAAHADELRDALEDAAGRLESGMDIDSMPWSVERPGADGPVRVSVSAMRRFVAVDIANRLRGFLADRETWADRLGNLPPIGAGVRAWPTA